MDIIEFIGKYVYGQSEKVRNVVRHIWVVIKKAAISFLDKKINNGVTKILDKFCSSISCKLYSYIT